MTMKGKGRLHPAYSLSGSEGEDNPRVSGTRGPSQAQSLYSQSQPGQSHSHYNTAHKRGTASYQQPQLYHVASRVEGLSDTPTSGNASDETLTDCELTHLAREWNDTSEPNLEPFVS
ncbi:Protein of unknown function [Cotesia congregata]|uniref:Uncharacterized protein n=1 Tax=Cotesia congregata TaxID=51543 RepID=A0A8J2EBJ4_COTCN|nr:Protein of unknown function [Cotesia congregata]